MVTLGCVRGVVKASVARPRETVMNPRAALSSDRSRANGSQKVARKVDKLVREYLSGYKGVDEAILRDILGRFFMSCIGW